MAGTYKNGIYSYEYHSAISGRFLIDRDDNNQESRGDGNVVNASVQLWGKIGASWVKVRETTTDANGHYSFTDLPDDPDYRVRFINKTGMDFAKSDVGDYHSTATSTRRWAALMGR
ncbi:SdrD B-like domain-containing protein [Paracoccaceae bacterium GXU_MW_L88]